MNVSRNFVTSFLLLCSGFLSAGIAQAHFPWLVLDNDGRPSLFFGEDLTDRTYQLPKSLEGFELRQLTAHGKSNAIALQSESTDEFVGLRSNESIEPAGCLFGSRVYGVYHGSKLVYYTEHLLGTDSTLWPSPPVSLDLRASVTPTVDGIEVQVFWKDKSLADADVKLFCDQGHEEGSAKTDKNGLVTFTEKQLESGLNAVMVGFTDTSDAGTLTDQTYKATMNYLTVTFPWIETPSSPKAALSKPSDQSAKAPVGSTIVTVHSSEFPDLPAELTSFGGSVADGKLFVYGGHTGKAHSYSTAEQSDQLWSLDLNSGDAWRELPKGPRLQGLAMLTHGDSLVRLGGFTAMNAEGETHDLQSQATVSRYDIKASKWSELTRLPEPRSSHAAAIIGDRAYVIGGWSMSGEAQSDWHDTAWSADLKEMPIQWKPIAAPGFQRRALSVASHDGKVFAVGGMEKAGGPSTRVDIYDPTSDQWSKGPSLVGEPMTGFGCSAQSLGGRLYVSTVSGSIQRLSSDGERWEVVGAYEPGRFFHCMLPINENSMVMVGGANMSVGRFTDLSIVDIPEK